MYVVGLAHCLVIDLLYASNDNFQNLSVMEAIFRSNFPVPYGVLNGKHHHHKFHIVTVL